jgi:hypothetical protein
LLVAAALFVLHLAVFLTVPLNIFEGLDVFVARGGRGPFPIHYVSDLSVVAEWPAYLDGSRKRRLVSSTLTAVPQGTEVEVRIVPTVANRKLLLTDGLVETAFVADGHGGMVARWTAANPTELRIAARFGEVLLLDSLSTRLAPIDDHPPRVVLAGAPAQKLLADLGSLLLNFYATDDHGLSQIDLVLESGQRRERKELASLDGRQRVHRGGYTLHADHELLKKAFLPVRVTIEARDGNLATGPSWGKSQAIVLLPPPLGNDVARRHIALRKFRRELSAYLANQILSSSLSGEAAQQSRREAHAELVAAFDLLSLELASSPALPERSLAFVSAQVEALEKSGPERALPEAVLLAVDSLIARLAYREAALLSKDLGAAVEELAVVARQLRFSVENASRQGLWDLLLGLQAGADELSEVGKLGLDLGSVAKADLARVERALRAQAYGRAEAAAMHLAERLSRANPSFSSSGGAGVESGQPTAGQGGGGAPRTGDGEGTSDAPSRFQELAAELDQLAQDNASELSELERLMEQAARAVEADFAPSEHTDEALSELREALQQLPQSGLGPESPLSEAAAARAQGEAMADAVESAAMGEAVQRGLVARESLQRAEQLAERLPGWIDTEDLHRAGQAIQKVLEQAERAQQQASEQVLRAQQQALLDRADRTRKLSERAKNLADRGRAADAPLPGESVQALQRAAKHLQESSNKLVTGKLSEAIAHSNKAQVELENALPDSDSEGSDQSDLEQEGEQGRQSLRGDVPKEERDRAKDYRRRVEEGLSRASGRFSQAVRRYAEVLK